jgi:hypothetical protein
VSTNSMHEHWLILYMEDFQTIDGRIIKDSRWHDTVPLLIDMGLKTERAVGLVTDIHRNQIAGVDAPAIVGYVGKSLNAFVGRSPEPGFEQEFATTEKVNDRWVRTLHGPRLAYVNLGFAPVFLGLEIKP